MNSRRPATVLLLALLAVTASAQEPPWDPARVKPCDRSCLTGTMDRYLDAMMKHDRAGLPLEPELRMTENAAQIAVGELEIEQLLDRNVAPQAIELLQRPRPQLVNDVPVAERTSREGLLWTAHSYFDALEGDSGKIGAFADDCVIFSFMTKLRPRRVLILDEQKGLASAFPLFVQDGTRRYDGGYIGIPEAPKPTGLPMLINMTTMETFGIRGGKIHEVEVFPFVVLPYGYGNGWTPGAGR